jgi:hypothetical protein
MWIPNVLELLHCYKFFYFYTSTLFFILAFIIEGLFLEQVSPVAANNSNLAIFTICFLRQLDRASTPYTLVFSPSRCDSASIEMVAP